MIKDFRLSGSKPNHCIGDFRISAQATPEHLFTLITDHNRNVKSEKLKLTEQFSQGASRKIPNGIQTVIRCGVDRIITVKTFRDGTSQVVEGHNG